MTIHGSPSAPTANQQSISGGPHANSQSSGEAGQANCSTIQAQHSSTGRSEPGATSQAEPDAKAGKAVMSVRSSRLRYTTSVDPHLGITPQSTPVMTTGYLDLSAMDMHGPRFPTAFLEDPSLDDEDGTSGTNTNTTTATTNNHYNKRTSRSPAPPVPMPQPSHTPHTRRLTARRSQPAKGSCSPDASLLPHTGTTSPRRTTTQSELAPCFSAPAAGESRAAAAGTAALNTSTNSCPPVATRAPRKRVRPAAQIKEAEMKFADLNSKLEQLKAQQDLLVAQKQFLEVATRARDVQMAHLSLLCPATLKTTSSSSHQAAPVLPPEPDTKPVVLQLWATRRGAALRLFPSLGALQTTGADVLRSLVSRLLADAQLCSATSNTGSVDAANDAGLNTCSGEAAVVTSPRGDGDGGMGPASVEPAVGLNLNGLHNSRTPASSRPVSGSALVPGPNRGTSPATSQLSDQSLPSLGMRPEQPASSGGPLGLTPCHTPPTHPVVMTLNLAQLLESPDEDKAAPGSTTTPAHDGAAAADAAHHAAVASQHNVASTATATTSGAGTGTGTGTGTGVSKGSKGAVVQSSEEMLTAVVGARPAAPEQVLHHSASQGASLCDLVTALPLLVLANPAATQLMGQPVMAAGSPEAGGGDDASSMWLDVLLQLGLTPHQLRLLAYMQSVMQAGAPSLKDKHGAWLTCVHRLTRLETSRKAQSGKVTLGGPLLRQGELVIESTRLMAASQSIVSLAVEVLMATVLSPAQAMELFRLCAPVFPDPIALCHAASVLVKDG